MSPPTLPGSQRLTGSFRDPSGFVFTRDGVLYRQVNHAYADTYERLKTSGLFDHMAVKGLLIPHAEVELEPADPSNCHVVLRPELVGFTSYPYEWCFGQLRDAALMQLEVLRLALRHGFWLKDCSAYNVQFHNGRPVLIDTLSFEAREPGRPWPAYRQFCQHFLAPLALMSTCHVSLGQLSRTHLDGVPLALAVRLLPAWSKFIPTLLLHLHLHARAEAKAAARGGTTGAAGRRFSATAMEGLLESLERAVRRLTWNPRATYWSGYYGGLHDYTDQGERLKEATVAAALERFRPATVWDFGANTARYSRLASDRGIFTVAFDSDPGAVEIAYRGARDRGDTKLLPLVMDLANPSPSIGWAGEERASLTERGPADMGLALALVHHLVISNHIGFAMAARFFARTCRTLLVEFVPATDSQAMRLLKARRGPVPDYGSHAFERAFESFFSIEHVARVPASDRTLYTMTCRQQPLS
jgi:hypothetical protein